MTPSLKRQFTLRLSDDLRADLQKIADVRERSLSWIVERALREWVEQQERKR